MLPLILFLLFSIASMAWAIYGKLKHQLLLTTDKKMESVAEESGFTDRSHMNRFFKQKFNCTPSQWVKENSQS